MSWDSVADSLCPIARSLGVVGDRWTLLIMRELIMRNHRFDEIQAQTGMSSHLLSTRLKRMEEDGIVERRQYSKRPPRYEYYQTPKGKELDQVILLLRAWGMKHCDFGPKDEPAMRVVHRETGRLIDANWRPPDKGKRFTFDDVDAKISKGFAAEREKKRSAFRAARGLSD